MKIAFDAGVLNERGTSNALFDYAHYGKQFLAIEPVILYTNREEAAAAGTLKRFSNSFELVEYKSEADKVTTVGALKPDIYYKILYRIDDDLQWVPGAFNACHSVFTFDQPMGDTFAYVSSWLSDYMSHGKRPFVPHIVHLPEPTGNFRKELGIPEDATVIGRHGGSTTFDLTFAHKVVADVLEKRNDLYFVFVNTQKFIDHPRALFLPAIYTPEDKANFIATCDAMLHARWVGESFGLAIAEFLYLNRPVIAWAGGTDQNHLRILTDKTRLYRTAGDLHDILMRTTRANCAGVYRSAVEEFAPAVVMKKFDDIFIKRQGAAESLLPTPAAIQFEREAKKFLTRAKGKIYKTF